MKKLPHALIFSTAFVLRVINLTSLPIFVDEAIYIRWSQVMAAVPSLIFLPLQDGKQPLFMWVLMLLVNRFSDPLMIGRLVSVVCGLLTVVGIYFLSKLLFKSERAALMASLLWAISPFAVFFDRLALVDSMLTMLGLWCVYFAILMVRTTKFKYSLLTGFLLGLALLTKSPALFVGLLIPFTLILSSRVHLPKLTFLIFVSWSIAFAMYSIQRLDPNFHLIGSRNLDYVYPYSQIFRSPLDPFLAHLGGIWNYFVTLGPFGLLILGLLAIYVGWRKKRKELLVLLVFGLLPILLVAEYSKVVTARYIFFTIPFFVVIASTIFSETRKYLKVLALAFLVLFSIQSLYTDVKFLTNIEAAPLPHGERNGYLEEWTAGQGIREIADFIKSEHAKDPDVKIVTGTEGYFGTLPNGLQVYLEGVPNVITIGVGLGITELPKSLKESKESGNKTYLVINKSRLIADPETLGLKLLKSFPKPERRVGSNEYIQYGPQEVLYLFEVLEPLSFN